MQTSEYMYIWWRIAPRRDGRARLGLMPTCTFYTFIGAQHERWDTAKRRDILTSQHDHLSLDYTAPTVRSNFLLVLKFPPNFSLFPGFALPPPELLRRGAQNLWLTKSIEALQVCICNLLRKRTRHLRMVHLDLPSLELQ